MKKILFILLITLFIFGCGNNQDHTKEYMEFTAKTNTPVSFTELKNKNLLYVVRIKEELTTTTTVEGNHLFRREITESKWKQVGMTEAIPNRVFINGKEVKKPRYIIKLLIYNMPATKSPLNHSNFNLNQGYYVDNGYLYTTPNTRYYYRIIVQDTLFKGTVYQKVDFE